MRAYKAVAPLENYASPNPDNCRYHMWEGSNPFQLLLMSKPRAPFDMRNARMSARSSRILNYTICKDLRMIV